MRRSVAFFGLAGAAALATVVCAFVADVAEHRVWWSFAAAAFGGSVLLLLAEAVVSEPQ